jgi:uncharacterized protein (DUF697 family)
MIVDMPGIMGKEAFERIALEEAKKAHGHIFCVDGEPYGPELELFNAVHEALPHTPKIVFVNKWDEMEHKPSAVRDQVRALIQNKMVKFVKSPTDIIFGSAQRYDQSRDSYVRQEIPQLLDRMYEDAGTLGMVMNVLDPASRAEELGSKMRDKVMEVRIRLARKVVSWFGTASVGGTFIPFSHLIVAPGILASMVYTLSRILGHKTNKTDATKLSIELLKASGASLGIEIAAIAAAEIAITAAAFLTGPVILAALGGLGYFKYKRTVILGEVTIEYIKNGSSWGGEDRQAVIARCKDRAMAHYMKLRKNDE